MVARDHATVFHHPAGAVGRADAAVVELHALLFLVPGGSGIQRGLVGGNGTAGHFVSPPRFSKDDLSHLSYYTIYTIFINPTEISHLLHIDDFVCTCFYITQCIIPKIGTMQLLHLVPKTLKCTADLPVAALAHGDLPNFSVTLR